MNDPQSFDIVATDFEQARSVIDELVDDTSTIQLLVKWSQIFASCLANGGTLFFAGNGGSFADALHLAGEFTGKMGRRRPALSAHALGANGSSVTAIANDYDYECVFSREFRGMYRPSSALLVMSTSGNSPSILRVAEMARDLGAPVLAFSGGSGGNLVDICESILVPSARTERIQEAHTLLGHILCDLVERHLAGTYFEWD